MAKPLKITKANLSYVRSLPTCAGQYRANLGWVLGKGSEFKAGFAYCAIGKMGILLSKHTKFYKNGHQIAVTKRVHGVFNRIWGGIGSKSIPEINDFSSPKKAFETAVRRAKSQGLIEII